MNSRLNVAKLAQIPTSVLSVAGVKSAEMESNTEEKKLGHLFGTLSQVLHTESSGGLNQLVDEIDELT